MVHSVLAVSETDKVKREGRKENSQSRKHSGSLFSQVLAQKTEEQRQEAPRTCHTTTYGQDSRLHTYQYEKREYHY